MSRLEKLSKEYRDQLLKKSHFNNDKEYNQSNPRAISDGDEHGKGDAGSGSVGSKTDILQKNKLLAKNKYSDKKPYCSSNA